MEQEPAEKGPLGTQLEHLPGIGTARAERMRAAKIGTVADVLSRFPRKEYEDFSGAHAFADLCEGEHASVAGEVVDVASRTTFGGRSMLTVLVQGDGGSLRAIWFNMPFMAKRFAPGQRVVLAGTPKRSGRAWEMTHPDVRHLAAGEAATVEYLATYPLSEGLRQSDVRLAAQVALEHVGERFEEAFTPEWLARKSLMPIGEAMREIHRPTSLEKAATARRRFIYEELLILQLALRTHRMRQRERKAAPAIGVDARLDGRIRARFPFEFTPSQRGVAAEIASDLAQSCPMNRLLQGDVGSGKTAVAIYAMLAAVAAGHQAAIMAPTELLARQHMATLERLLAGSKIVVELLVGGQTPKKRRAALDRIEKGSAQIVVGTQAIVASEAKFGRLGLVVIDEQHRFGVTQRRDLQKGGVDPHVLIMTATPIPRTIALAMHGDLDLSVLRESPAGRRPVRTYRVGPEKEDAWWDHFRKKLGEGRQGYVVVPAVDESKKGLASVASTHEALANGPLEAFRLGLVHGRLRPREKQAVMEAFRAGSIDVLVCTSVIEVGIDVPNATLMAILDAESFGLAQLHQLRGRVARGPVAGICGAVAASATEPHPRIDAFVASTDGFALADQDFRLRGSGEFIGTRQSGLLDTYIADLLDHTSTIEEAREDAIRLLASDPELIAPEWARLKKLMFFHWKKDLDLGPVG